MCIRDRLIGVVELFLVNFIIEPFLTSKSQIGLTRALLEYTFECMLQSKELNVANLQASLKNNPDVLPKSLDRVKVEQ